MPIRYYISPELHMVIYVCRGLITAAEVFTTADIIFVDKRREPGLITVIDLLYAVENLYLQDVYETTQRIEKRADEGFVPGPIVLLSRSTGIHILVDTIKLLPSRVPFRIGAFHTMQDAITSLDMLESREEIVQFWHECNSLCENL
jgi:hypothetical protein